MYFRRRGGFLCGDFYAWLTKYSIKWAEKFGQDDINGMVARCCMAFDDYDDFQMCMPKWYTDKYKR